MCEQLVHILIANKIVSVAIGVFYVSIIDKYHHICFLPSFMDTPLCYALRAQLGYLFHIGFISCFPCVNVNASFPFFIFFSAASTSHDIIGGTYSGYVCIVTAWSLSYNCEYNNYTRAIILTST